MVLYILFCILKCYCAYSTNGWIYAVDSKPYIYPYGNEFISQTELHISTRSIVKNSFNTTTYFSPFNLKFNEISIKLDENALHFALLNSTTSDRISDIENISEQWNLLCTAPVSGSKTNPNISLFAVSQDERIMFNSSGFYEVSAFVVSDVIQVYSVIDYERNAAAPLVVPSTTPSASPTSALNVANGTMRRSVLLSTNSSVCYQILDTIDRGYASGSSKESVLVSISPDSKWCFYRSIGMVVQKSFVVIGRCAETPQLQEIMHSGEGTTNDAILARLVTDWKDYGDTYTEYSLANGTVEAVVYPLVYVLSITATDYDGTIKDEHMLSKLDYSVQYPVILEETHIPSNITLVPVKIASKNSSVEFSLKYSTDSPGVIDILMSVSDTLVAPHTITIQTAISVYMVNNSDANKTGLGVDLVPLYGGSSGVTKRGSFDYFQKQRTLFLAYSNSPNQHGANTNNERGSLNFDVYSSAALDVSQNTYYFGLPDVDVYPICVTCRSTADTNLRPSADDASSNEFNNHTKSNVRKVVMSVTPDMKVYSVEKEIQESRYGSKRTVRGHMLVLYNPIGHFNVIPPAGGCRIPKRGRKQSSKSHSKMSNGNCSSFHSNWTDCNSTVNGAVNETNTTIAMDTERVAAPPSVTGRAYQPQYSVHSSLHHVLFGNGSGKKDFQHENTSTNRSMRGSLMTSSLDTSGSSGVVTTSGFRQWELKYNAMLPVDRYGAKNASKIPMGCHAVTNGGFFNVTTGECFGHVVTNNQIIQTVPDASPHHSTSFGIRNDGMFVMGYISESDIYAFRNKSNSSRHGDADAEIDLNTSHFDTLISGLGWLVRYGNSYIDNSLFNIHSEEHFDTAEDLSRYQSTGDPKTFANVISARTAIGYDVQGRLVILQIEGKTWSRGVNLYEFADFMVELGFYSGLNLDGGGSDSMSVAGNLISEPSWRCPSADAAGFSGVNRGYGIYRPTEDPSSIAVNPEDEMNGLPYVNCEKEVGSVTCIHVAPPPPVSVIEASSALDSGIHRYFDELITDFMDFQEPASSLPENQQVEELQRELELTEKALHASYLINAFAVGVTTLLILWNSYYFLYVSNQVDHARSGEGKKSMGVELIQRMRLGLNLGEDGSMNNRYTNLPTASDVDTDNVSLLK